MIKGSTYQDDVRTINIQAHNIVEPKYKKQILTDLKGKTQCNITLGEELNAFTQL